MGNLLNIFTKLHKKTSRDYIGRMTNDKIYCSEIARRFDEQFWDGDRKFGYGGYKYDGRWSIVAEDLIEQYHLTNDSKILDVGCGKAHLLYEIKKILSESQVTGIDISNYAVENGKEEIIDSLFVHDAREKLPFQNNEFDLVFSLNTIHNFTIDKIKLSLQELERVAKNKYMVVEAYRNVNELFNLQCWALTCEAFFRPEEWVWMINEFGYTGDYEFIYF